MGRTIEVPLPPGAAADPNDLEALRSLLAAVASVRIDAGGEWESVRRQLEASGWKVRWGLAWHVEARRGHELEQACGHTLDEAFGQVWQVARQDPDVEGTP
jgi:hypothetical protein